MNVFDQFEPVQGYVYLASDTEESLVLSRESGLLTRFDQSDSQLLESFTGFVRDSIKAGEQDLLGVILVVDTLDYEAITKY